MKSLRVFVCILVATFTLFGGLTAPEKTFAADTYDSISAEVLADFSATQSKFDAKKADMDKKLADGKVTAAVANQYSYNYSQYTDALNNIKTAYLSAVETSKSGNLSVYDGQSKAVSTAVNTLGTEISRINAVLNTEHRQIFLQLSKELNTKFEQYLRQFKGEVVDPNGLFTASSTERIQNSSQNKVTTPVKAGTVSTGNCTFTKWTLSACVNELLTWFIKNTLLEFGGFFVWLSANMLNYSIQIGVLDFEKWAPDTLYPIWMIIRQIVSLAVVFVGLYLGFLYILGKEDKFEKYIPWVVIFALFVNFSYPLARTAIDISNIVSLKIYTSAVGEDVLNPSRSTNQTAGALIMDRLGLQGMVMSATSEKDAGSGAAMLKNINSVPGAFVAVLFVFYAAYIFFMATGIMVMRTLALVFISIASPFLLVDSLLPVLGDKAKKIREIFFAQLAVGPVFMIMLALTLKFLEVFSKTVVSGATAGSGGIGTGTTDTSVVTFFNILMMLVMLHIMITVTKKVSGSVGEFATNKMGKVGGFGLGVAGGGVGFLARKGIGGLALKAKQSTWVQENQNTIGGRVAMQLSNSLANSSFDVRNTSVAGRMNKLGMGMGMGTKLGFEGVSEEKSRKIAETSKGIKVRHSRDVFEVGADGQKKLVHKEGDVDHIATAAAKRRFAENLGGSSSIFQTKEQKRMIEEKLKSGKGEEMNAMVEEYKKFENTEEGRAKKKEFFDKQSKEIQERLTRHDREVANEILSEYRELDETAEGRARKQEFFDKQGKEIQEKLTRYDLDEQKKKDKEAGDQKNKEETLQAQKDLAQAQKDQVEISKKQADLQQQQIDLLTRQSTGGAQGVGLSVQQPAVAGPAPAKSEVDLSKVTLETEEQAAKRSAPFEPSLESDAQIAKRLEDVDAVNDNVLEMTKRVISKASKVEEPPVTT